jgi:hypothetical protein
VLETMKTVVEAHIYPKSSLMVVDTVSKKQPTRAQEMRVLSMSEGSRVVSWECFTHESRAAHCDNNIDEERRKQVS